MKSSALAKRRRRANPSNAPVVLQTLRAMDSTGNRHSDEPTPEWLKQAGNTAYAQSFEDVIEIADAAGKFKAVFVKGKRVQRDAPLEWLLKRGHLGDPFEKGLNFVRGAALAQYREHWHASGRCATIAAMDPSKPVVSGGKPVGLTRPEGYEHHNRLFQRGANELPLEFRKVVDAIVLNERAPAEVGAEIGRRNPDESARLIALDRLKTGADRLRRAYKLP